MSNVPDLETSPQSFTAQKKPLKREVEIAPTDGVCKTLEGEVSYRSGDAIMTGEQGEQWPIQADKFAEKYRPAEGTSPGESGTYEAKPSNVLVMKLDTEMDVPVGWQDDPLKGKPGDYLVQYGPGDHGVIQSEIFQASYEPVGETVADMSRKARAQESSEPGAASTQGMSAG